MLPVVILAILLKVLPPWKEMLAEGNGSEGSAHGGELPAPGA
jgi:hypothetical protein